MKTTTSKSEATFDFLALPLSIIGSLMVLGVFDTHPDRYVEAIAGLAVMAMAQADFLSFKLTFEQTGRPPSWIKLYALVLIPLGIYLMFVGLYGLAILLGLANG